MKNKKILIPITIILIIIIISFIYTTFPRLELNGKKNITLSYRDEYQDPGVIVKNANNSYLSKVKINNNINNDEIGNYYVDYSLKIGTSQLNVRRNVKIIDDIAPVIKLKGNQIIELSVNEEYKEPGYIATDEYDGDLTDKVEVTGEINIKNYGEYVIKYKVKDNSNNTVEVNRIVKIIDEIPPQIICNSEYSAFEIGNKNIIGCKAIDNFDGDITENIKVNGEYDINKKGTYNIEYTIEDDAGNKTKTNHNIIIYEPIENKTAYIITNDNKEIIKILEENKIKATILNQTNNNEYTNNLKESGYQIGLSINNQPYKYITEIQKYCTKNKIEYIDVDNTSKEQVINKLNNKKTILYITSSTELKMLIQILQEMNYSFDTINNIK